MLENLHGVGSFGGSIDHLACCQATLLAISGRFELPFVVRTMAPHILGVLRTDCSYTCHSFPIGWSPYSSKRSCTCWNQHFPILDDTTKCPSHVTLGCPLSSPTLWKPSGLILSPVEGFLGESLTWARVCFAFSKHSFRYCASTSPFMCGYKGKHLVISLFYHTNISSIINPFF